MKILPYFLLLSLSFETFGQAVKIVDPECKDPVTGEVTNLANAINKTPILKFDPKFCKAFNTGCGRFTKANAFQSEMDEQEDYFLTLDSTIETYKKSLVDLEKQLIEYKAKENSAQHVQSFQTQIRAMTASLLSAENDNRLYKAYKADPKKNPNPLKATTKQGLAKMVEDREYEIETKKKELYYKDLPQIIEQQKKLVEETVAQGGFYHERAKTSLLTYEKNLADYQKHLADPKKIPHPMKADGFGLTAAERYEERKEEVEEYYKSNLEEINEANEEIKLIQGQIAKAKAEKDEDLEYYESMLKNHIQGMAKKNKLNASYQAYLKNPKAFPKFFEYNPFEDDDDEEEFSPTEDANSCEKVKNIYESVAKTLSVHDAGTCGVLPEELVMMKHYSDDGYGCMNTYLRQKKLKLPDMEILVGSLNRGLSRIPSYEGLVKRGATLPQKIRNEHKVGSIVTYDSYTSTSTSGGFSGSDMFYIFSKTGKPIMGFSDHVNEDEVLFKSGAKFKVLQAKTENIVNHYILKDVTTGDDPSMDKKIIDQVNNPGTEIPMSTAGYGQKYYCPLQEVGKLPASIKQDKLPVIGYPKTETAVAQ